MEMASVMSTTCCFLVEMSLCCRMLVREATGEMRCNMSGRAMTMTMGEQKGLVSCKEGNDHKKGEQEGLVSCRERDGRDNRKVRGFSVT